MRQGVSIVWDSNGKFFQVWQSGYNGDGKAHAEKIAAQISGTVLHIEHLPETL